MNRSIELKTLSGKTRTIHFLPTEHKVSEVIRSTERTETGRVHVNMTSERSGTATKEVKLSYHMTMVLDDGRRLALENPLTSSILGGIGLWGVRLEQGNEVRVLNVNDGDWQTIAHVHNIDENCKVFNQSLFHVMEKLGLRKTEPKRSMIIGGAVVVGQILLFILFSQGLLPWLTLVPALVAAGWYGYDLSNGYMRRSVTLDEENLGRLRQTYLEAVKDMGSSS